MSTERVCDMGVGRLHEFALSLDKAGFTAELAQKVISSPGNKLAQAMRAAAEGEVVSARKKLSKPRYKTAVDGVITFSVTSDGTTGLGWLERLKASGHRVSDYAEQFLRSADFVPTNGVTTKLVVLPGKLWTNDNRLTKNIRAEADGRKLVKPNAEMACLVRMQFTNEEIKSMGLLWLVVMHEPIKDAGGNPFLLTVSADDHVSWLDAFWDGPGNWWGPQLGFVFALPQV